MDENKPIGSRGGYAINWDEIDENTNPFGSGIPAGGTKLANSPAFHTDQELKLQTTEENPKHDVSGTELSEPINNVEVNGVRSAIKSSTFRRKDIVNEMGSDTLNQISVDVLANNHDQFKVADVPPPDDLIDAELPAVVEADEMLKKQENENRVETIETVTKNRRPSNSSAHTFVLTPGNRSPVPSDDDVALEEANLPPDEELVVLRAENKRLANLVADMQRCIAEYEISLRQMAEERERASEKAKESVIDIISERDQAIEEISTIEKAFGDLHGRFEKSKQIIEKFKQNEDVLKKSAEEYLAQMKRQEQKYHALKIHAEQKLLKVAEETELLKRNSDDEVMGMRAAMKRADVRIRGLESQLEQKLRENTELTKICDELLSKYGNKT